MLSYTTRTFGALTFTAGVTRIVIVGRRYAVKIPNYRHGFIRGWLANQSEWQQRNRPDALTPRFSLLHLILVFPVAWCPTEEDFAACPVAEGSGPWLTYTGDEAKTSSWGWYHHECLLIDYDRAWDRVSLSAWFYYKLQDRKGRRWAKL